MGDPQQALTWVKSNVQTYLPATKITGIMVGNEVLTLNNTELSNSLVPAMKSVYAALVSLGLDKSINVTTAHSLNIMGSTYPPSAGAFEQDYKVYMQAFLSFHVQTGSPFLHTRVAQVKLILIMFFLRQIMGLWIQLPSSHMTTCYLHKLMRFILQ